jgi:hypothetical protein
MIKLLKKLFQRDKVLVDGCDYAICRIDGKEYYVFMKSNQTTIYNDSYIELDGVEKVDILVKVQKLCK